MPDKIKKYAKKIAPYVLWGPKWRKRRKKKEVVRKKMPPRPGMKSYETKTPIPAKRITNKMWNKAAKKRQQKKVGKYETKKRQKTGV